jgi:vinculin
LTPILTKMTVDVDQRVKELTHQIHREMLVQHLEQIKNLTPSFISSIKIYLLILSSIDRTKASKTDNPLFLCLTVKEFLIKRLTDEIEQIVRLLLLTSHDEDEWISDEWFKQKRVRNIQKTTQ